MPIIAPTLPADGQQIDASDVNDPIQAILNVINGGIDGDNIDPAATFVFNEVDTDTINEKTTGSGVTIDGLLVKDGKVIGGVPEMHIFLGTPAGQSFANTTAATVNQIRHTIDFSKITGLTAAYFVINVSIPGGATFTGSLYNETDSAVITGSTVTTTSASAIELVSGDIHANLPTASKRMTVQSSTSSGSNAYTITSAHLVLQF